MSVARLAHCVVMSPLIALFLLPRSALADSETTAHTFCSLAHCGDGFGPDGIALDTSTGNLFGVTYSGGTRKGCSHTRPTCNGVIYEYAPETQTFTVLYKFCKQLGCASGRNPYRVQLVIDTAGNLYGTTEYGGAGSDGGVVFELVRGTSSWHEKVLYSFCSRTACKDGSDVRAGLTYAGEASGQAYDGASPLYGTTFSGGAYQSGTVFAVAPRAGTNKWSEQVLYSFCAQANCTDGSESDAAISIDGSGNLFGTTTSGGQFSTGGGTVFELSPNGANYTETVVYSFCARANCADGQGPHSGVAFGQAGQLFGTTREGGSADDGVLFELSPSGSTWQYNALENFDGSNGANSLGPLLPDGDGGVYGTTAGFTDGTAVTVFHFNDAFETLYTFCRQKGCPDGGFPVSNLVEDASGDLFGTNSTGGAKHDSGTLFELSP